MLYFLSDYTEGAHPQLLARLNQTNLVSLPGYGEDEFCAAAKDKIRAACELPGADEIRENLGVKIRVVRSDPLEKTGERMKLNCGHTVAHAVEKATGYAVSHGEAVAMG